MAIGTTKSTKYSPSCLLRAAHSLVFDKRYFWTLASLVIVCDAVLTQLIIKFIPYTEIDWETYMVHVDLYLNGERNYSKITGPTGPLVYPAGHVYVHDILHYLTDSGNNIPAAQQIYAGLYVLSLLLTCAVYRNAGMPNWTLLLLPLSKRLHSIFVLRLFNDCWSVVFVQAAILACQTGVDGTGVLLYSLALSVKMSALLYLPGLLVVLFKRHGMGGTAGYMAVLASSQILLARPFLGGNTVPYIQNAFNFSRVFLQKWTVNWRFLDEEVFLSPSWAMGLLLGHVTLLTAFGLCRWCRNDGGTLAVIRRGFLRPSQSPALSAVSPDYIATVLMTSNLIGILFARSLHYQFYSWYCQQLPLLCQRTKYPLLLQLLILAGIEYAWNVFPSTTLSSGVLLAAHVLLLLGIWFGFPEGKAALPRHLSFKEKSIE
ncbi:glycosyltransferase family 58 protein [Pisolithus microcarpus 441]|uniref:Dol-P-Man:Man(5)GlcNAc(2)-PP-Dol alpha-1,3-mannosyltransferase n=1 Tax=Pisolithus microcarpus 441 TaxID=765257 RepID=A0A0C9Z0J2_9AGAM|nr:glycosyltransferase family 58 protein [Pisolithus microcarpus 441]